jgi:hypothetical protein
MATNVYFNQAVKSEQLLYEDIIIESLKMYGQDVYYIPRELTNEDKVFGDDSVSKFSKNYKIEMYIENVEGFDGEGDLFSKFGVEIRDEATFIVSRRRWNKMVSYNNNDVSYYRPREGDLIHLPLSKSTFQIMKVETQSPFYQLSNLPTFKMRCSLFEYNDEDMDTGIDTLDAIEEYGAYQYVLNLTQDSANSPAFAAGEYVTQTLDSDTALFMNGNVVKFNDSDGILYVAHAGATDGAYHTFTAGLITGLSSGATGTITSIGEDQKISQSDQSDDFSTDILDFVDFSESNPFGDID